MEIQTGALVIVLAYMVGMMIIGYVVGTFKSSQE